MITYATHRNTRTYLPPADQCPLCASKPGNPTEIPDHDYNVAVFENRFPSFAEGRTPASPARAAPGPRGRGGLLHQRPQPAVHRLPPGQARLVVDTWADRTAELGARDDVEQVFPFENRGREIGVTLNHPHGQIYAYPFLPPRMRTLLGSAREHQEVAGSNLFADVLAAERKDGTRVVAENEQLDRVRAGRPPAGRSRCTCTRTARSPIDELSVGERDDFAELYLDVLSRFDGLYGEPLPYIAAWHQAPVRIDRELGYLHLELLSIRRAKDKIKYLAGSESGWARSSATPGPRMWPSPAKGRPSELRRRILRYGARRQSGALRAGST